MEPHQLALPSGFRLANYELTKILGKGSFGITYLGIDRHLGRKVAIKELIPDSIVTRIEGMMVVAQSDTMEPNWEWAKERFLEEASALASLKHPNIVEVYQLIEANGTVYMAMDYIEGESYEARLRRIGREPDEASARRVLEPLLDGLEEVHAAGLLHRDIKPANILLRSGIDPVLLDFGSARKLLEEKAVMTSLVTHGYSPIEQYQVNGKQGPWTDIYALGTVAVRAITGEKAPMSMDRLTEDDFVWLSHRGLEGFSPLFLQAIDWALQLKPTDRPQDTGEWRKSFGWARREGLPDRDSAAAVPERETPRRVQPRGNLDADSPTSRNDAPPVAQIDAPKVARRRPAVATPVIQARKPRGGTHRVIPALVLLAAIGGGSFFLSHRKAPVMALSATPLVVRAEPVATPHPPLNYPSFVNGLGMPFAPVTGIDVLFCVWDVRVRDYELFVAETKRRWMKPNFQQGPDHPAVNVSWNDAKAFCEWLSAREGRLYRLPTDTEWSAAVGLPPESGSTPKENDGNAKGLYPWGTKWPPPEGSGNYATSIRADDHEKTSPVGSFEPNRYGLYDMSGNVWQWCEDFYDQSKGRRVLRGGAWNIYSSEILLSSFRYYSFAKEQSDSIGFRCVTPVK